MKARRIKKNRSTPLDKMRKPMAPPGKVEIDIKKYRRGRVRAAARTEIEDDTTDNKP